MAAHGHGWVRAVETTKRKKIKCDLVAVAALPAPASELPRQHGVPVAFTDDARRLRLPRRRRRRHARRTTCSPAATSPASPASTTAISAGARCGRAVVASFSGNGVSKSGAPT